MIAGNTSVLWAFIGHEAAARCVNGDPSTVLAGTVGGGGDSTSPGGGVATPVEGGFRLTGRWPFASGCHQAEWMLGPSIVMEDERPRLRPDGRPDIRGFFLPAADCHILDTWDTTGLRGTGSHDWQVADLFVPEAR